MYGIAVKPYFQIFYMCCTETGAMSNQNGTAESATAMVNLTQQILAVLTISCWLEQVRTMSDSRMLQVEEAGPSIAVQMVGLNSVPTAGDEFTVCASEPEVSRAALKAPCLCISPPLHYPHVGQTLS